MEIRIKPDNHTPFSRFLTCIGKAGVGLLIILSIACSAEKEHTAPAINPQDSVATMTTYGVNTLISDSGIIKYRISIFKKRRIGYFRRREDKKGN